MHPFAPFIQILGKGRHGSRSLTQEEARAAFGMILDGQATPEQVGAFLMLIRVREESAEEAAGFVAAVRERIAVPEGIPVPAIDWGSYAGKRRHLPWFLLAARLLAQNGLPVFMHGTEGESGERLYTRAALAALGLSASASFAEAGDRLAASGFAFLPLEAFAPELKRLMQLRELLGLRSPVHSVARMLNPLGAPLSVHGIFHRGYERIHQQAAILLREPGVVVFKGEGGEAEINPEMPTTVFLSRAGRGETLDLPPRLTRRQLKPERLDPAHLKAVWEGEAFDRYGEAAVCGTVAVVLRALGRAGSVEEALALAHAWWQSR
jgi:anthranilate phosphoribosyltransferase